MRADELAARIDRAKDMLMEAKERFDAALRQDAHRLTPDQKLARWETFLADMRASCTMLFVLKTA